MGDGKKWVAQIITNIDKDPGYYDTNIQTKKGKVTNIDIPFSRFKPQFNKDDISFFAILRNVVTGMGPAGIKVFDFEIY